MTRINPSSYVIEALRAAHLEWLLPNLRQDPLVWKFLCDLEAFEKVNLSKPSSVAFTADDFSPARLALVALGQTSFTYAAPLTLFDAIDGQITQASIRSYSDQNDPIKHPSNLAEAGKIGIALAYRLRATNSWQELISQVSEAEYPVWATPIACILGLIEDPLRLLRALIQPGASLPRFKLAIHAILSNPYQHEAQIELLLGTCLGPYGNFLPAESRSMLVDELNEQDPQAAASFCSRWLRNYPDFSQRINPEKDRQIRSFQALPEVLFEIRVREIAGSPDKMEDLIELQKKLINNIYCDLITLSLPSHKNASSENSLYLQPRDGDEAWIDILRQKLPATCAVEKQAEIALSLYHLDHVDEANKLLPLSSEPLPDDLDLLYAVATTTHQSGNQMRSNAAAKRIMEIVGSDHGNNEIPVWGKGFSLCNLGQMLADQQLHAEACRIFELALETCPNDARLLDLLAENYRSSNQNQLAVKILDILVALNPDNMQYHREYAQCLADIGEWEASLDERTFIFGAAERNSAPFDIGDNYSLAHSALKAKHPDLALKVSLARLEVDSEDAQSLIYAGEAYLALEDKEKGLECLVRATQLPTQLPQAWLTLAEAHRKLSNIDTVIETLKNAAQAIPGSAEIEYALGDVYLNDSAPTQALPSLQRAAEISPDEPKILLSYGEVLYLLGHSNEARQVLARAYQLDPEFPELAQTYANLLIELNMPEEAISPLEQLINSKIIQAPGVYLEYARCVLRLHEQGSANNPPMKALIALNELLQINPRHAEAKALTAEALAAGGDNELAFQAYRDALETLPEDKRWFERLSYGFGCIASRIGKHDIAVAALQEACQANPDNPASFMALSDAYFAAELVEDAVQSARNVLVLDGDNPDRLAWFANQVTKLFNFSGQDLPTAMPEIARQAAREALNALNRAIQLAPTKIDLLIQLGKLQASLGATNEAHILFNSIAGLDCASIVDLTRAAEYLSNISDHQSAIASLEKAINKDQLESLQPNPTLYLSLAQEYVDNNDCPSAINILDRAMILMPDDSQLVALKVNILLGSDQVVDAMGCIESYLCDIAGSRASVDLLFLASQIRRSLGNFAEAFKYAKLGEQSTTLQGKTADSSELPIKYLIQIAELYRSFLQPQQAFQILQGRIFEIPEDANEEGYSDYLCLQAELALEIGEQIAPELHKLNLEASNLAYLRLASIHARLMNNSGKSNEAVQYLLNAISKAAEYEAAPSTKAWYAPNIRYTNLISLADAAMDLNLWELAVSSIQQMLEPDNDDPLPHLFLSKYLVHKAEFASLCEIFEICKHKPGMATPPFAEYDNCLQHLNRAQTILQAYQNEQAFSNYSLPDDWILRWQVRANMIFRKGLEENIEPIEVLSHRTGHEDAAALIPTLHHLAAVDPDGDAMASIIKLARTYPSNPAVILQIALALQDSNPTSAMKSLLTVIEQNASSRTPALAFCNVLLSRIALGTEEIGTARQAIESAIEFWQDEPGWHALAANICKLQSDMSFALQHLLEASRLAPENYQYQMELGLLYKQNANEDSHMLIQAAAAFENTLTLNKDNVDALVNLATTQYLLSDIENAYSNARYALALAPDRTDIYQLLGEIAIRNQDYQGAYEYANRAILTGPKDTRSTMVLVKSLSALGRYHEAIAKLNTAIPSSPDAKGLYLQRVAIIRQMDGPRAALHELVSMANTYPNDFEVLNTMANAFLEAGDAANAIVSAKQALKSCRERTSRNEQANLHLMIGQLNRQSGQLDQAIQHLGEAIQLAPDRLEPYLELGLARKERREYQQALLIFEQASMIAPDDPRALYQAGLALKESKDYKSSESMLRRAVSLAPNDLTIRRQLAAVVALNLVHNPRLGRG